MEAFNKNILSNYRIRRIVCVILSICAAFLLTQAVLTSRVVAVDKKMAKTQQELAQEVFRFHVLANSDSKEDQAVKLKVRDAVIAYMKTNMPEASSSRDTKQWAQEHLDELQSIAQKTAAEYGFSYGTSAQITTCYFPDKRYGDIVFPKGYYEALRIRLGEAKGQNWWCVLYPNLCFTNAVCAVVDEDGKEELASVLTDDEYEMVTAASKFQIKSYFFGDAFNLVKQ